MATTAEEERHETLPESIAGLAYVLVAGLFVMTFLFQNFAIPSGSMKNTLLVGDHVVVDRITLAPRTKWMPLEFQRPVRRGDVIVFVKPNPETPDLILVKRAIGLPGDRIHLEHGILFRNGERVDEPQISVPADDGSPTHAYQTARDDFPRDLEGIAAEAAANNARPSCSVEYAIRPDGACTAPARAADIPFFVATKATLACIHRRSASTGGRSAPNRAACSTSWSTSLRYTASNNTCRVGKCR